MSKNQLWHAMMLYKQYAKHLLSYLCVHTSIQRRYLLLSSDRRGDYHSSSRSSDRDRDGKFVHRFCCDDGFLMMLLFLSWSINDTFIQSSFSSLILLMSSLLSFIHPADYRSSRSDRDGMYVCLQHGCFKADNCSSTSTHLCPLRSS